MMKMLLLLILILNVTSAFAFGGNSLTWQKLSLEEKVQRKFNVTLSSILKDNQYLVEVEAEMADPGSPNFGDNGHKSGPKVSDIRIEESRGDYIAFSKMGLEVPVVEKFLDEDRTKLMNLYRFNEAYDLFKNLSALKVTVFLSDKIPTDLVEIVKKVIASSRLSVSGIKPNVKFESISMEWIDPADLKKLEDAKNKKPEEEKKAIQEEPKIWAKDWYEWASRWGNAVGLILGAIIIGVIAIMLFKQWKDFMEKFAAQAAAKNQPEEDKKEEEPNAVMTAMGAEAPKEEEEVATSQGFERFQQCLEQHPDEAVNMIRSWLNESDELSLLALRGIAQQSSSPEMEKLMAGLSEPQRDKWKSVLGVHLEVAEINNANKHIFTEVVREFLVPSRIKDGELLNLIMELNAKTTCEFIEANEAMAGMLLNTLSPSMVSRVLSEVDDETADAWLEAGTGFNIKTLDDKVPSLKAALIAFKESHGPSPFTQRIMTMIPTATPAREGSLFRALAKSGNASMVVEAAKKHFPGELVLELPGVFLKEIIQSYPMAKRIEFFHSRPEDVRTQLLDTVAEKGTPARDLLDMELENIARDPSRGAAIESRSDEIWQDFAKTTRTALSKNASYAGFAEQLIKEWSQKLGGGLAVLKGGRAA
jgi:hypothetical protein